MFGFSYFVYVSLSFRDFYYSKMAEYRSPIPDRLQDFLDDFWNFQNFRFLWTRSGPMNPVFIIKIFQKYKKVVETSLKHNTKLFISENLNI